MAIDEKFKACKLYKIQKKERKIIVFERIFLTMQSTAPYVFYESAVYYQFGEFSIAFAKGANNTYTAKFPDDPDSQLCAAAFSRFLREQLGVLIESKSLGSSWECYFCDEDCYGDYPKSTISEIAIPYSGLCKLYGR